MLKNELVNECQVFTQVKPHFNLRQTSKDVPTIIYCVYSFGGHQYKITTGLKVYPSQWNNAAQLAIESNLLRKNHNRNNCIANRKLSEIKAKFKECVDQAADSDELASLASSMALSIYPKTARRQAIKTRKLRYENQNEEIMKQLATPMIYHLRKINAKRTQQGRKSHPYEVAINKFAEFIKATGIADDMSNLNLSTLNQYKEWLESNGKFKISTVRGYQKSLVTLINDTNEIDGRSGSDLIDIRAFKASRDTRSKKEKQANSTPLTEVELVAVSKVIHLTPQQEEARDMFFALICSGQRISDLSQVMTSETFTQSSREFIVVNQKKTDAEAVVMVTPRLAEIRRKYQSGMKYIDYTTAHGQKKLRDEIHRICKIAGLDRDINGTPFYDVVHPHTCRHTFSTLLSSCRVPDDIIAITTGHSLTSKRRMLAAYIHDETKEKARMLAEELKENEKMQKCFIFADPNGANPQTKSTTTAAPYSTSTETSAVLDKVEQLAIEKHELKNEVQEQQAVIDSLNCAVGTATKTLEKIKRHNELMARGIREREKEDGRKRRGRPYAEVVAEDTKQVIAHLKETISKALDSNIES